jgi:hypothetical protein
MMDAASFRLIFVVPLTFWHNCKRCFPIGAALSLLIALMRLLFASVPTVELVRGMENGEGANALSPIG